MAHRIVDLSVALQNDIPSDPPRNVPVIEYTDHDQSAEMVAALFPACRPRSCRKARAGRSSG